MKKILLIASLSIISFCAKAQVQNYDLINYENCAVTIQQICYDPGTCAIVSTGSVATVACCGGTGLLSFSSPACPGSQLGFQICWNTGACSSSCAIVNASNLSSGCYPMPALLPICPGCIAPGSDRKIFCNPPSGIYYGVIQVN